MCVIGVAPLLTAHSPPRRHRCLAVAETSYRSVATTAMSRSSVTCSKREVAPTTTPSVWAIRCFSVIRLMDIISHLHWPACGMRWSSFRRTAGGSHLGVRRGQKKPNDAQCDGRESLPQRRSGRAIVGAMHKRSPFSGDRATKRIAGTKLPAYRETEVPRRGSDPVTKNDTLPIDRSATDPMPNAALATRAHAMNCLVRCFVIGRYVREMCRCGSDWPAPSGPSEVCTMVAV